MICNIQINAKFGSFNSVVCNSGSYTPTVGVCSVGSYLSASICATGNYDPSRNCKPHHDCGKKKYRPPCNTIYLIPVNDCNSGCN